MAANVIDINGVKFIFEKNPTGQINMAINAEQGNTAAAFIVTMTLEQCATMGEIMKILGSRL